MGKRVKGKEICVKQVTAARQMRNCSIVFISASEKERLSYIMDLLRNVSVLTIGDNDDYGRKGVMVNFYMERSRVRFEMNPESAKRVGIVMSAQLLKLAKIVRTKLILICLCSTASALVLASLTFIAAEYLSFRHFLISRLTAIGDTIGSNVRAALVFHDSKGADETLETLNSQPDIEYTVVNDKDGKIFAIYRKIGSSAIPEAPLPTRNTYHIGLNRVDLYRLIVLDDEFIGTVRLQSDITHFYARVTRLSCTLFMVIVLSLAVSYLLLTRLQAAVTGPLFSLSELMKAISDKKGLLSQGGSEKRG